MPSGVKSMAYKVGGTQYFPGVYGNPSIANTGPAAANAGGALMAGGANLTYVKYTGTTQNVIGSTFSTRSILTHGYLAGGYKGSSPWRTVNKTWHATDATFYVGEQLDRAMAYGDGTFSDYNAYVHGCINAFSGSSSHTSSYNLHTGQARQKGMQLWDYNATSTAAGSWNTGTLGYRLTEASSGDGLYGSTTQAFGYLGTNPAGDSAGTAYGGYATYATTNIAGTAVTTAAATDSSVRFASGVGGWDTYNIIDYHGCATDQAGQVGYIFGGGAATTNRLHFPTEVMYTTTSIPGTVPSMTTCTFGETRCWIAKDTDTNQHYYFTYSNQTFTTWNNTGTGSTNGAAAWQKALSSKLGNHYWAIDGTTIRKVSDSTGNTVSSLTKTWTSSSEENMEMGQNWGYMLGNYNGQQNNQTEKYSYSVDTVTQLGAASMPKGHYGQSSAACSSAAALITIGSPL